MNARALITGILGQDGWYLSRHLRDLGYEVFGTSRQGDGARVFSWDGRCQATLRAILSETSPCEIYNLAGFASGARMSDDAVGIGDANGLAVVRLLETMRLHAPAARLVQASSREVFGAATVSPQDEDTPRRPRNAYGAAKAYADSMIAVYRDHHALHASSAILFNHESERRSPEFVTRKVTLAAARIRRGLQRELRLENLESRRDWGFAGDYMRGLHAMARLDTPRDFVFATGVTHSVRELCDIAFARAGLDYRDHVRAAPSDPRPPEACELVGNAARARRELGWSPQVSFRQLIETMVDADMQRAEDEGVP